MLDAYELVKQEDSAAATFVAQQGTATGGLPFGKSQFAGTEYREFLRRFRHENFFISMETNAAVALRPLGIAVSAPTATRCAVPRTSPEMIDHACGRT